MSGKCLERTGDWVGVVSGLVSILAGSSRNYPAIDEYLIRHVLIRTYTLLSQSKFFFYFPKLEHLGLGWMDWL